MEYENDDIEKPVEAIIESTNLVDKFTEDELLEIGEDCKRGFDADMQSRQEWEEKAEEWTKLAKLTIEHKTYPWPNASNVKYPLLATAAMQFSARAYPSLLPSDGRVVKSRVIGKDPDGQKTRTAEAVSIYMSYQLLEEMDNWEGDMDRLLIMLPIIGTMFKKTYWDPIKQVNCSKLVLPRNLVVDYWAKSLSDAERISEIIEVNERLFKERVQSGLWKDIDLGEPSINEQLYVEEGQPSQADGTTPYVFIEQHTYLDVDDDGYKEPYIVTFHKDTEQVVRIVPRFDKESMYFKDDGTLQRIEAIQYYTKYGFLPNPDGSFYDIGFGVLLGPLNESVNTLINQLVDAGTLSNLQSGFIGKGLRLRMGETRLTPGEWRLVNSTGDDLKKQIVPLPAKEPSKVLFDLMMALIQSGKELASVAEIFVGKMPGQNTPATTTMASIEQGMKVFTAVYKRIYRSMSEEFHKLYRLNSIYLNPNTYVDIVDMQVGPEDFSLDTYSICPAADPTAVSQTEKLMKAQALMEMLSMGMPLDPVKVMVRMLEAQEQPNWQELIPPQIMETGQMPPPPPDPKLMAVQAKTEADKAKTQGQLQALERKAEIERVSKEAEMAMKQQEHEMDMQHKMQQSQIEFVGQVQKQRIFNAEAQAQAAQGLRQSEETHQQSLRHGDEASKAKVEQTKAQAKAKPQPKGKSTK